jgi:hypothetical protein
MKKISFNVKRVTIVRVGGTDQIFFWPDLPTPFPEMKYEPSLKMETRAGYAEEWLREAFGIEADKVIETPKGY